MQLQIITVLLC